MNNEKKFIKTTFNNRPNFKKSTLLKDNNNSNNKSSYASSNAIYTQPHFYSPLHTPQNWQIPSKRQEIYLWARYFYENEPKIAASIDFYSQFPVAPGFELQHHDKKKINYFNKLLKKLKINDNLSMMSSEYYMLGDVFPFLGISCPTCHGSGYLPNGESCPHKGGSFNSFIIMNPDWIEVHDNPIVSEPLIQLMPDENLRRIVTTQYPQEMFQRIPERFRAAILKNQPIKLSNRSVSHLKHQPAPYGVYGTSLIRRLFKTLAYKDRLMTANWIIAERLILPVRIVKIGNDERPAGAQDIADIQAQLATVQNDPNLTLVTHHAFEYEWVGANNGIVQLQGEYDYISSEILDGVMLPQAVLTSEMGAYQGVQIGANILIRRLENWRNKLKDFIEERIFLPEAKMQGFIDKNKSNEMGEPVYDYPNLVWNDMGIKDESQKKQQLIQLHDSSIVSTQTLAEEFELDYDQEIERIREEMSIQATFGALPGSEGGMGGGGGLDMGGGGLDMGGGGLDMGSEGLDMGGEGGLDMGGEGGLDMGGMSGEASNELGGTGSKVMKRSKQRKKSNKKESEEHSEENKMVVNTVQLTSLERKLFRNLFSNNSLNIPYKIKAQFSVPNAVGKPFVIDFAVPAIKVGIEADGELHNLPGRKEEDMERDEKLKKKGWTILRFSEKELNERMTDVIRAIKYIVDYKAKMIKKMKEKKADNKKKLNNNSKTYAGDL